MPKSKFDPDAAFKHIVGVADDRAAEKRTVDAFVISRKVKEETKSKRVNLVIKPSVYILAKIKCERVGISFNDCINQFLEKWSKE